MKQPLLLHNIKIYTEKSIIENGYILIQEGIIAKIGTGQPPNLEQAKAIDGRKLHAIPGFIDGHIHGANGADVMDGTPDAIKRIAAFLPNEGVTSFLPTTITQHPSSITSALKNIAEYNPQATEAEIVGIHLEGPFIAKQKAGAQPVEYIQKPSIEQFAYWQDSAKGKIKTVTIAPELDEMAGLMTFLSEQNVNISAGHTNATFKDIKKALKQGLQQLTHLCNAMNGIHHREIGPIGAAFTFSQLRSEIIADGIHVAPEMLKLVYDNIGSENLLLITDSMRAKGLSSGVYDLGGYQVTVEADKATLEDGTLAGSTLTMIDAAKNMRKYAHASVRDIIKMASVNPAKQIDIYTQKGSLQEGKVADMLLVDEELNLHYTICQGSIAFKEGQDADY
ncbi:N-acetylglucosamine-6-phosphate deacetylase [Gracilibacillus massiliensis]|uniref:N-acetylglucosamine-6-phosphate deacetylase n=1 Tax=Gracilibacillus massiliensis TaxID=1564956 RepID=UPI00071E1C10|nr:N-acetylglucosamine-6-phosphate deacetylase [Gracilibacillus massiliensis]